jgi:MFS family permease
MPWRMLLLLAVAELGGMSLWLLGSAVGPLLAREQGLTQAEVGWLTTVTQLGFVAGTAVSATVNLADVVPSRRLFAWSALCGAIASAPLALGVGYDAMLLSRACTGACLAGVYPPAMKMAATWFRERRGLAVGAIVGALTLGKALPYLAQAVPAATVAHVAWAASGCAVLAAALVALAYRDGPHAFPARPFAWSRVAEVLRIPAYRHALGGYLGHMAELYSFWTWIPAFLVASEVTRATAVGAAPDARLAAVVGVGVIAVGAIGCLWGGIVADRVGRARLVTLAMAVSGACALAIGFAYGRAWWLLAPLALTWGFFVIADSAQFSVLVTEQVPGHVVGTALTLQLSLGFLLTTLTIQVVPPIVARAGWPWAFALLALGPAFGIASIRRLGRR